MLALTWDGKKIMDYFEWSGIRLRASMLSLTFGYSLHFFSEKVKEKMVGGVFFFCEFELGGIFPFPWLEAMG